MERFHTSFRLDSCKSGVVSAFFRIFLQSILEVRNQNPSVLIVFASIKLPSLQYTLGLFAWVSVFIEILCVAQTQNHIVCLEENNVFMCREEQFAFVEEKCIRAGFKEMKWSQRAEVCSFRT